MVTIMPFGINYLAYRQTRVEIAVNLQGFSLILLNFEIDLADFKIVLHLIS